MTLDDLKKLATGSVLFSLDRIISPRMVNILYLMGLASIGIWAINHLFLTFGAGFGAGLWGLIEIAVFGLLGFVVLRITCELIIVFLKANASAVDAATQIRPSMSLIDEVRDAIEELADEDVMAEPEPPVAPAESQKKAPKRPARKPAVRTAKRTPRAKND